MFVNELSSLKYIGVAISCDNNHEMCVVKSAVVKDFSPNVVGQVQLRPFCGDPIQANLIRLTVFSEPETSDCSIDCGAL